MQVLEYAGTPKEIGRAFGEDCREAILELYQARVNNALEQAKSYGGRTVSEEGLLNLAQRCLPIVSEYSPLGFEELSGVAEGCGLKTHQVWGMNALTDLRDVLAFGDPDLVQPLPDHEGCSSFVVRGDLTEGEENVVGQTWDLATDNMPFVRVVVRKPKEGPMTTCLTTVGCLSLIGLNEAGIAVGTTNIRTTDSRPGVGYLDVIHKALSCDSFEAAAESIRSAPRAGAHYFYLSDGEGRASGFECSAQQAVEVPVENGAYVHCNHILEGNNPALEVKGTPMASSQHRQKRLSSLIQDSGKLSIPASFQGFMADTAGGENAINRHDYNGISSNGSVVMAPGSRRFWAVHGPADQGTWIERLVKR